MEMDEQVMVLLAHEVEAGQVLALESGDVKCLDHWKEEGLKESKARKGREEAQRRDAL